MYVYPSKSVSYSYSKVSKVLYGLADKKEKVKKKMFVSL